ncbi:MAG: dehydrogenase, partial [Bacteroidetes bacterium]|nr:dehydrogenase [Bacteroidota bacterium]
MANIHEHAVLSDVLEKKGSGFVAHHGEDFLKANNGQWIGFSMEIGPEGGLYVLDWHDADICGKDVLNKETGRIYRIVPENSLAENWEGRYGDLNELSDQQLVELQTSKSNWHARRARLILQNRAFQGKLNAQIPAQLKTMLKQEKNQDYRLRMLWALHLIEGMNESELLALLSDSDEYIRAWTIQLLCEDQTPSSAVLDKFAKMADSDPSSIVRMYLASSLQRLEPENRHEIAKGLVTHKEDANDHNIPKMIWFGVEEVVAENPEWAMSLAEVSRIPLITEFIARRMVDANQLAVLVEKLGKARTNRLELLNGMRAGLEGRNDLQAPKGWDSLYGRLKKNEELKDIAIEIAQLFGDSEAAALYLATLDNPSASADSRINALKSLAQIQRPELKSRLSDFLDDPVLRPAAIQAVAAYEDYGLGETVLKKYPEFSPDEKLKAVQALSSRSVYGRQLTSAIKSGEIPRRDIPAYVARQLRRVVGNGFVEVWGPIDQLTADKAAAYQKYQAMLTDEKLATANPASGKVIFQQTCGACHKMYDEGGNIGPDITGSNRANLDYLLSNILDPSGEIQDDYRMVVITTRDGRTYSGNIASENERQVFLRVVGQENEVPVSKA